MDARPRKRQKKLVVESSDDDDAIENGITSSFNSNEASRPPKLERPKNKSQRTLPTRTHHKENVVSSNANSRSKASANKPQPIRQATKSNGTRSKSSKSQPLKPISAFFSEQPNVKTTEQVSTSKKPVDVEAVDAIEDDSTSEESHQASSLGIHVHGSRIFASQRPRSERDLLGYIRRGSGQDMTPASTGNDLPDAHNSPWSERFSPKTVNELVVNSTKIKEVRGRLRDCISCISPKRLLIVNGPSGSGKSITLKLLAEEMNLDVVEWKDPVGASFQFGSYASTSDQFDDFLNRSRHSGGLKLSIQDERPPRVRSTATGEGFQARSKLMLIEDLPSNITFNSSVLQALRFSVLQHLSAAEIVPEKKTPGNDITMTGNAIVFIFTETSSNASTADDWALTPRKVLGSDILDHPRNSVVDFNPIATTFLGKALNLVINKVSKSIGGALSPAPGVVKKLSVLGDARSAVNALEMLCTIPETERKQLDGDLLETTGLREGNLGLFHAVGKVLYNKREEDISSSSTVHPPSHLSEKSRPNPSLVEVDKLIDQTGTDTTTFVAALFENYAPSCAGLTATASLDGCLEALSDADLLDSSRSRLHTVCSAAQGDEWIKNGEFAFNTAARGTLFALPHPVRRRLATEKSAERAGGNSEAYKMAFPAVFRSMRQIKEAADLTREVTYSELAQLQGTTADCSVQHDTCRAIFPALPEMMSIYLPYSSIIGVAGPCRLSDRMNQVFRPFGSQAVLQPEDAEVRTVAKMSSSRLSQRGPSQQRIEEKSSRMTIMGGVKGQRDLLYLEEDDIEDD